MLIQLLLDLERHLEKLGRRDEQQAIIDDLKNLLPTDVPTKDRGEVCVRQGDLYTDLARYSEARPLFDQAFEIAEQINDSELRGKVLRSLSHTLWRQGKYDEAVVALKHVLKKNPESVIVHLQLGLLFLKTSKYDEAFAEAEQVSKLKPSVLPPAVYFIKGSGLLQRKNFK